MGKNTHKKITIIDPKRWGINYNERRQWYYKLRLDFFSDPLIQMLDSNTKIVFLLIVNESLRSNSATVSMCLEYAKGVVRVPLGVCKRSVMILKQNNIVDLETNLRNQLIEENRIEYNKSNADLKSASVFDFDAIYKIYPRKQGKASGMKKLQQLIKSQADYDNVLQGVKNYATYCKRSKIEKQYIKQFSTWVNQQCWNDDYTLEQTPEERLAELEAKILGE